MDASRVGRILYGTRPVPIRPVLDASHTGLSPKTRWETLGPTRARFLPPAVPPKEDPWNAGGIPPTSAASAAAGACEDGPPAGVIHGWHHRERERDWTDSIYFGLRSLKGSTSD